MSAEPKPVATQEATPPAATPAPAPTANVPTVAPAPKPPLVAGGRVTAIIPTDVEQVFRLAQAIAAAGWAPKSYLVDPRDDRSGFDKNKIVVGIMQGMEVGLSPMAALQSIAVINGMPSLWGDGALAVVRASGLLVDIKEEVFFDDKGNADYAVCTLIRAGQKTPVTRVFTRAQAQKARLTDKKGPWQDYPQRMLQMRARAWAMRDGFADVMRGMAVGEEAEDIPRDVTAQGSHTTVPEPRRADFVPQGGGYDPGEATPARPTIIDAQDENAQQAAAEPQASVEPEGPYEPEGGWTKFAKFSEFVEFSTDFLGNATTAQATAWNANYATLLQHNMTRGSAAQKDAVNALLKTYGDLTRAPASDDDIFPGDKPSQAA